MAHTREKITLADVSETMLATLHGKALDSRAANPILGDHRAYELLHRVDYDFTKTGTTAAMAAGMAMRTRQLDLWTAEFLAHHPDAVVLHLACGLDTRYQRLEPPPSVRWIDLDQPEVIALRRRLLPPPSAGNAAAYRTIAASVTDNTWLADIPGDRPTLAVFEGLTMYLRAHDGKRLIQRLTNHFPTGQLLFDCWSTLTIRLQQRIPAVRNSGSTAHWGLDDPNEIENWHHRLTLLDAARLIDLPGADTLPRTTRAILWAFAHIPGIPHTQLTLRYQFSHP